MGRTFRARALVLITFIVVRAAFISRTSVDWLLKVVYDAPIKVLLSLLHLLGLILDLLGVYELVVAISEQLTLVPCFKLFLKSS